MSSIDTDEPDRCLFMSYGHDPAYLERAGGDLNKALDLLHKDFPAKTFRGLHLKSMIGSLFPLAPVPSNFQEILEAFGFRFPEEYAAFLRVSNGGYLRHQTYFKIKNRRQKFNSFFSFHHTNGQQPKTWLYNTGLRPAFFYEIASAGTERKPACLLIRLDEQRADKKIAAGTIWHMALEGEYPLTSASTEEDVLREKRLFLKIADSFFEYIDSLEVGLSKVKS